MQVWPKRGAPNPASFRLRAERMNSNLAFSR